VKSSKYIVSDVLWQIAFKATNFAGVSLITTRKTMIHMNRRIDAMQYSQ